MRQKHIFHHDHYYHTLKGQIGEGIPVFHGVRQRGGGLGSVLGGIARYALPLLMKYVFPHARDAAIRTVSDVTTNGASLKSSLKKNGIGFIKNVGVSILKNTIASQSGQGIKRKIKGKKKSKKPTKRVKKTLQKTGELHF
jgi:hypothetical protein